MDSILLCHSNILRRGEFAHLVRAVLARTRPKALHYHDFFEILWVQNGQVHHYFDGGHNILTEGDLPPEMVANLRAGNIDGYLGPDPFNQRAVYEEIGFLHLLTKDLWDGHPCCAFGTSTEFIQKNPQMQQQLRAPIFEDKVVDYVFEQAAVTDKEVSKDDLQKAVEELEKE